MKILTSINLFNTIKMSNINSFVEIHDEPASIWNSVFISVYPLKTSNINIIESYENFKIQN
jgi:hypothetical protein